MLIITLVLHFIISVGSNRHWKATTEQLNSTTTSVKHTKTSENCWVEKSAKVSKCWESLWRFWRESLNILTTKVPKTQSNLWEWSWRSWRNNHWSDAIMMVRMTSINVLLLPFFTNVRWCWAQHRFKTKTTIFMPTLQSVLIMQNSACFRHIPSKSKSCFGTYLQHGAMSKMHLSKGRLWWLLASGGSAWAAQSWPILHSDYWYYIHNLITTMTCYPRYWQCLPTYSV